jgi:nitrite reductase (NADH) large subunit
MPERLVILGNSAAALAAVRAIGARPGERRITIVSREACNAYSPVLTTYYLRGLLPEQGLFLCDEGYYREREIECVFGRAAVALDTNEQTVLLDDGSTVAYDKLLLATGASPRRLPGLDSEIDAEVCYLRTIEDARRIRELASRAERLVIVGAGLVGTQVANAVARPDLEITCVEMTNQLLVRTVDADCARLLREHIERSANVRFVFGRRVVGMAGASGGYAVALDAGEQLCGDVVVAGIGVAPNIAFLDPAQIALGEGVLVDERMRTSAENVYAAGDVAQGTNRISGRSEVVPNWINACEQGAVAGANMAGADLSHPGTLPENVTTQFGLPVASIGVINGSKDDGVREVVFADEGRGVYRKLWLKDERVIGAILLRDVADAGVIRAAITDDVDPGLAAERIVARSVSFAHALRANVQGGGRPSPQMVAR